MAHSRAPSRAGILEEYDMEQLRDNGDGRGPSRKSSPSRALLQILETEDLDAEMKIFPPRPHSSVRGPLILIKTFVVAFITTLIPSFLRRSPDGAASKKLHPTAYLDGLRGVAAFIVFIHHYIIDWYPMLCRGYASSEPAHSRYFLQLPLIRVVYSGRGMVSVFFVISGYVLSYKAIRLMRARQYSVLLDSLASSIFRRGMRLFIPITGSTFISMLFCRWGWYSQDPMGRNTIPARRGDFWFQFKDWCHHVVRVSNPLLDVNGRDLYAPPYDGHLWTIPIEYRGSIIVFLALLCVAKLWPWLRLSVLAGMVLYSIWDSHWEVFLFLSGILFCDIHFQAASLSLRDHNLHLDKSHHKFAKEALLIITSLFALHLVCFPDEHANTTPGYRTLIGLTPRSSSDQGLTQRFWMAIGAFLLVGAINFSTLLQRPFTTPLAQYLGRISFALYIVHGPVLYTLGMKMLLPAVRDWNHGGGWVNYALGALGAWVVNLVVCVVAADVFWREVDARSVGFAGWVAQKCWDREETRG
ncbi:hypothetical protein VE01_10534 [Pseudogymnoascus verrucosus]|uniref:Acyltransferase 3 domain-containing protein n=1 Tax=Pseudogymnoascus verrucosus TaxID=342668 RepID=A0A1B8G6H3_9PEZI|nr:uncharacterized protein VE01_10534 [Pseudogymnoascus verrucosus]OBT91422.1 hypothetical protein VE01_10534 [Pseudogymnoascus verrucosus]